MGEASVQAGLDKNSPLPVATNILQSNVLRYLKSMACLAPKMSGKVSERELRQLPRAVIERAVRAESGGILTVASFHSPPWLAWHNVFVRSSTHYHEC